VSLAWYQFSPKEDIIDIEVKMLDNSMPPMVRGLSQCRPNTRSAYHCRSHGCHHEVPHILLLQVADR